MPRVASLAGGGVAPPFGTGEPGSFSRSTVTFTVSFLPLRHRSMLTVLLTGASATARLRARLSFTGATFSIGKRSLTVTADGKTKTYGDADPALTFKVTTGSLAFSDAFTGALSRVAGENVGTRAIGELLDRLDVVAVGDNGLVHPDFDWQHRVEIKNSRFGAPPSQPTLGNWGPVVVPKDHFFMMGDNRYCSKDSRYWGGVPRQNLMGRGYFVFWPFTSRWGFIK